MSKLIYLWFAVKTVFCTCQPDHRTNDFKKVKSHYKISKIGKLPAVASESSGLARGDDSTTFWTHNDSGGKAELYEFNLKGDLLATKAVPNAKNRDWEDLAKDEDGIFYIGDIGNNASSANTFEIYKFDVAKSQTERIAFQYKDQKTAAKKSKTPISDSESLFHHKGSLYLLSKNWGRDKSVKLYKMPAKPGSYDLQAIDSIRINAQVTSAAISPDGKRFALLTYGKVLLFEVTGDDINFSKPSGCFRLSRKQTEAITFLNNTDMLVTNEQGNIYRVTFR
ncbi:SdiA-regulated/phytase-like domain-containing protein [Dyadobacter sp. MSC1_007]|jgi:hypothetical protein|uniref:hypothetical protein n=1 Tax=Dyadobacter sp. MSC1_007 TaxID=2909264 RepID=UPI0020301984|nr:hypothetical protein [Dyadobacter sp. MSC1_007]